MAAATAVAAALASAARAQETSTDESRAAQQARLQAEKATALTPEEPSKGERFVVKLVAAGQFEDPRSEEVLSRAIIERRDAIGREYLPAINPIVHPVLENGKLRFGNAAVEAGFAEEPERNEAVWSSFDNATGETEPIGKTRSVRSEEMPAPVGVPTAPGKIVQIELGASSASHPSWAEPVHAYFRRDGDGWKLVGFERMPD